jgi:hypothetical protein
MSGAAEIRVEGRPGVFVAAAARIDGGAVHAEGRWRRRVGPNNDELRFGEQRSYTWPLARCAEIRWQQATA